MDLLSLTRMILGSIFVLFIPGFAWTFAFFEKNEIDAIERIALSFGFSVALVPLTVFCLNSHFHVKITGISSFAVILILTAIPLGYIYLRDSGKLAGVRERLGF